MITAISGKSYHGINCYAYDTVNITVVQLPELTTYTSQPAICAHDTAFIVVNGADSYNWVYNDILTAHGDTAFIHPHISTGTVVDTFTVWGILADHECRSVAQVPFTIYGLPDISIQTAADGGNICSSDTIHLQASGGVVYQWFEQTTPATFIGYNSLISLSPSENTSYYVYVENEHGCHDTLSYLVTVHGHPSLHINMSDSVICRGMSVQLDAVTSGHSFVWNNPLSLDSSNIANPIATPQVTTTYTVDVTDTITHCNTVDSVTIHVNQLPTVIPDAPHSLCLGDSLHISLSGASYYDWYDDGNLTHIIHSGDTYHTLPDILPVVQHNIIGTDVNGCKDTLTVDINIYALPELNLEVSYPGYLCVNRDNFLGISVLSDIPCTDFQWVSIPHDISLMDEGAVAFISPDTTTTYIVTSAYHTDGVVCGASDTTVVQVYPVPDVQASVMPEYVCFGGDVVLSATGAGRYMWTLNNQILSTSASYACTPENGQQYVVVGIDTNNCIGTDTVTIEMVSTLPTDTVFGPTSTCVNVPVTVYTTGRNHCEWFPAIGLSDMTDSSVTMTLTETQTYWMFFTDEHGCYDSLTFTMTVYHLPDISMPHEAEICQGEEYSFRVTGASAYVWEDGSFNDFRTVSPDSTTQYIVTAYNQYQCSITDTLTLSVIHAFELQIVASRDSFCLENNAVTLTAYGAGDTYEWSTGETDSIITVYPTETTTYTLTAYNTHLNCSSHAEQTILRMPNPDFVIMSSQDYICKNDTARLWISGNDCAAVIWNTSDTLPEIFVAPEVTTTYHAEVTSSFGCISQADLPVEVKPLPQVRILSSGDTVCLGELVHLKAVGNAEHYQWNTGIIGDSLTIHQQTNSQYVVTAYSEFLCSASDSIYISINPLPEYSISTTTPTICTGDTAIITLSGQNHVTWYPSGSMLYSDSSTALVSPKSDTIYTAILTNQYGCTDTTSIGINVIHPQALQISNDTLVCYGQSVTLHVSGSWNYIWSNGESSNFFTVTPNETTVYTVSSEDEYGCVTTAQTTVFVQPDFDLVIIASRDSFCLEDNVITLTAYGAGDTFEWSTGSRDSIITVYPTESTVYTLTAYNVVLGCSNSTTYPIIRMPDPDFVILPQQDYICKDDEIELMVSHHDYTQIVWNTADTTHSIVVSPDTGTLYSAVLTNLYGCHAHAERFIDVKPRPQFSLVVNDTVVCYGHQIVIQALGDADHYQWNNGYVGDSLVISQPTDALFNVTAYSEFLCTSSDSIAIAVYPLPEYTVSGSTQTLCVGDTVRLTLSGENDYYWFPDSSIVRNDTNSIVVMPETTTDYLASIVNQYGCADTVSLRVEVYPPLPLQVSADTLICYGESVMLHVTGAWNYSWSNGETSTFFMVTPEETTVYAVSSTDEHGCVTTAQTTVNVQPYFDIVILASRDSFCLEDNAITLTAYGAGDTFEWSTGSRDSVITVYPTESTVYTITAFNTAVQCSNSASYPIIRMPDPDFVILPNQDYICHGDGIVLSVSNSDYVHIIWNTSDTTPTLTLTPDTGALYSAVLTNSFGCHAYSERYIDVKPLPQVTIVADTTVACLGEQIQLQVLGNADHYVWNTNHTGSLLTLSQLTNTQYTVTAYSEFQCIASDSINVAIHPLPDYSITVPDQTLCVGDTAVLTMSGQNNWQWSPSNSIVFNDNTLALAVPESTTDYTAHIINQFGCADTISFRINVYPPLPLQVTADTVLCQGQSVSLHVTGSWNYIWSNGETASGFTVTPSETTVYSVSSTDENGCVTTRHIHVQVRPDFNFDLNVTRDTICVGDSTTLWCYGSADQHVWSTGSTENYIVEQPASTSTYSVWAYNNSTACAKRVYTTIVVIPHPQIMLHSPQLVCPNDTVNISVSSYHHFDYQWYSIPDGSIISATDSAIIVATPPQSSYYHLTASNQFCEVTDSVWVETSVLPTLSVNEIHDETCEGRNGSIGINVETDYPPAILSWSNGYNTTEYQIFNLSAGSYDVTATDHLGCSQTLYNIVVDNITPPVLEVVNIEAMLNMHDGAVTLQVTHYYGDYTIEWFSDRELLHRLDQYTNQLILYGLEAGDYWVLITDEACSTLQEIHIPRVPDGQGTIYVPNAFTPTNHDGLNDYFSIYFSGDIEFEEIFIFTRWGELVFYSDDPYFKWDGYVHNKDSKQVNNRVNKYNIYDYVIHYKDGEGNKARKAGSITIL